MLHATFDINGHSVKAVIDTPGASSEDLVSLAKWTKELEDSLRAEHAVREAAGQLQAPAPAHDFEIQHEGSLIMLEPRTVAARVWAQDNLPRSAPRWGNRIAIEPRYFEAILDGIIDAGLTAYGS